GLSAFRSAVFAPEGEVRLHQFVRTVESFLPPQVFGENAFAKHAERFLADSDSNKLLREMYRLRNKSEHHLHFEAAELSGSVPEATANLRTHQAETLSRELFRRSFVEADAF